MAKRDEYDLQILPPVTSGSPLLAEYWRATARAPRPYPGARIYGIGLDVLGAAAISEDVLGEGRVDAAAVSRSRNLAARTLAAGMRAARSGRRAIARGKKKSGERAVAAGQRAVTVARRGMSSLATAVRATASRPLTRSGPSVAFARKVGHASGKRSTAVAGPYDLPNPDPGTKSPPVDPRVLATMNVAATSAWASLDAEMQAAEADANDAANQADADVGPPAGGSGGSGGGSGPSDDDGGGASAESSAVPIAEEAEFDEEAQAYLTRQAMLEEEGLDAPEDEQLAAGRAVLEEDVVQDERGEE